MYYCTTIEGYDPNTDVYNTDVSDSDQWCDITQTIWHR